MNKAKIGFVGCGTHSTNNLYPMLNYARASLEAVCDTNATVAQRNKEMFGAKAFHTSLDEMLDKHSLDGVMIVGPSELHRDAGLKVLSRGIPVFVEKPTAPDLAAAEEMAHVARKNNTFFMTAFMKRHGLTYGKIREHIKDGRFVPQSCFMKYMHWPWGSEGDGLRGMVFCMSSHAIDLVLSFFGTPNRIQCTLARGAQGCTLGVTFRFPGDRMAQLMLGSQARIQERFEMSGRMEGSPAFFVVDNVMNMELHREGHSGIDVLAPTMDQINPDFNLSDIQTWRPDYGLPNMGQTRHFVQGFAGEVREFCNAILDKRMPNPDMDDSLRTMRIMEAIVANPDGTTDL